MAVKTMHFRVGNGDMTLILLESGRRILVDIKITDDADDEESGSLTSGPPEQPLRTSHKKGRGSLNQPKGHRADRAGCDHVEPIAGPLN